MATRRIPALILSGALLSVPLAAQQTADRIYQEAIEAKEGTGDLETAVALFLRIIDEHPQNRRAAALAQLQIGLCHELRGLIEAEKAFQTAIDSYPEQRDVVRLARQRLSASRNDSLSAIAGEGNPEAKRRDTGDIDTL